LGIETQENVVAINVYEERVCDFDYPDGLAPNYYTQGVQRDYISAEYNPETHMNMFVRAEVLLQRAGQLPPRALGSLGILKIWEEQIGYTYALATQALIALSVPHPRQAPPVVE